MSARSLRFLSVGLLAASVVLSAAGQLGMKAGMEALGRSADVIDGLSLDWPQLQETVLWTGGGLVAYALSLLAWLAVLVRYPLSFAYPFLGLSYVLVYLGATQWARLMETPTPLRTVGTLLIIAGVGLVSFTRDSDSQESLRSRW